MSRVGQTNGGHGGQSGLRAVDDTTRLEYGLFASDIDDPDGGGMLAKASRTLQEHVRDVAEKTKSSCCGGRKAAAVEKDARMRGSAPVNDGTPVRNVYDNVSGTTYTRGRLLGKVSLFHLLSHSARRVYAALQP